MNEQTNNSNNSSKPANAPIRDVKADLDRATRIAQLGFYLAQCDSQVYAKQMEMEQILQNKTAYEDELRKLKDPKGSVTSITTVS